MYDCAQTSITFNNLNIPTYDIHSKEARQQILFNFQTLTNSFIHISSKHIQKSKQQNDRINKLKDRILKCKQAIQGFESSNQALIFVSPSDYPKKYKFDPQKNVSIFKQYLRKTQVNKLDMNAHYQVKHDITRLGDQSKLKISQLNKFVVFMLGQLQGKKRTTFQKSLYPNKKRQQTLGNIPSGIEYIDSLLLFNSHINPYRKYEITNNVMVKPDVNKKKEIEQIQKLKILTDGELTIFKKEQFTNEAIAFIREQEDLQQIDFDDLGLLGVVEYNQNTVSHQQANLSETIIKKSVPLDPLANKAKSENTLAQSANLSPTKPLPTLTSTQSAGTTLPPPPPLHNILPPPPSNITLPPPPTMGKNLLPPPPIGLLPPPPPLSGLLPPPPLSGLLPPPPISLLPPPPLSNNLPKAPTGSGRSALLQQLQNPNPMARLKKVVTVQKGGINSNSQQNSNPTNENGQSQPQKPARQMSFMEALQAKIKSRFLALHPQQESQEQGQ